MSKRHRFQLDEIKIVQTTQRFGMIQILHEISGVKIANYQMQMFLLKNYLVIWLMIRVIVVMEFYCERSRIPLQNKMKY